MGKDKVKTINKNRYENELFKLSTILALGVTFYARLEDRGAYVQQVSNKLGIVPDYFVDAIKSCQGVFIDEMRLENTIAKNDALMENVWMMAISIGMFFEE